MNSKTNPHDREFWMYQKEGERMAKKRSTLATAVPVKAATIKTVRFRASIELKPYNHIHIECEAEVGTEDPALVLADLKMFVAAQLKAAKEGTVPVAQTASGRFQDLLR